MPLFEGGQFNKAALGPLQNLFRSRGGEGQTNGGGVFTGPYAPDYSGGGGNNFWEEGLNAQEDFESAAGDARGRGQWFQNIMNGKSKQPLINKEDQTMRLPNFLFPKQNPKSILNLPGKLFNQGKEGLGEAFNQGKEGLEKAKDAIGKGYGDVFGEGGMLAKADFGGVVNPWAARDAKNAGGGVSPEEGVVGDQGGMIDPTTHGEQTNMEKFWDRFTPEEDQGGVIDPSTYDAGSSNVGEGSWTNKLWNNYGNQGGQDDNNVQFNMSNNNSPLMQSLNQGWEGLEDQANKRGEFKNIFESKLASGQDYPSATGGAYRDATSQINPEEHPQHQIPEEGPGDMSEMGQFKSKVDSNPKLKQGYDFIKMMYPNQPDDAIYKIMMSQMK